MSDSQTPTNDFPLGESICPRCHVARLRAWHELNHLEREFVARLPAALYTRHDARVLRHRWCRNCWYEESQPNEPTLA